MKQYNICLQPPCFKSSLHYLLYLLITITMQTHCPKLHYLGNDKKTFCTYLVHSNIFKYFSPLSSLKYFGYEWSRSVWFCDSIPTPLHKLCLWQSSRGSLVPPPAVASESLIVLCQWVSSTGAQFCLQLRQLLHDILGWSLTMLMRQTLLVYTATLSYLSFPGRMQG